MANEKSVVRSFAPLLLGFTSLLRILHTTGLSGKLDSLSLYSHGSLIHEPALTDKFIQEYLKDRSGVWDIGTYAPPCIRI